MNRTLILDESYYFTTNHACGICGAGGRLNCHELWQYDDKKHIQKLMGFIALCDMCHHVKHIGFAGILARQGKLDMNAVIEHFMTVNRCTKAAYSKHNDEAFEIWKERSRHNWKVDLSFLDSIKLGVQNGN